MQQILNPSTKTVDVGPANSTPGHISTVYWAGKK